MTQHPITIEIKRLAHGAGLPHPAYATAGAAGMDVVSAEDVTILPGGRYAVASGFALGETVIGDAVFGDHAGRQGGDLAAQVAAVRNGMTRHGGLELRVRLECRPFYTRLLRRCFCRLWTSCTFIFLVFAALSWVAWRCWRGLPATR